MKFDLDGFSHDDGVSGHPTVHNDLESRIEKHCTKYYSSDNGKQRNRSNPFVIADIGCGDGSFTTNLVSSNAIPLNIVNITKYLIDPNCNTTNNGKANNSIFSMTADEFVSKCPSNHCDIIICKYVCHLLRDFDSFLKQCKRILKPNGVLYIILMSDKLNFKHFWGNVVQQIYDKSRNNKAHNWVKKGTVTVGDCNVKEFTVQHCHLSQKLTLNKQQATDFIKYRAWSSLQRVDQSVIDRILLQNATKETIDLEIHWSVSEVRKLAQSNIQSKL